MKIYMSTSTGKPSTHRLNAHILCVLGNGRLLHAYLFSLQEKIKMEKGAHCLWQVVASCVLSHHLSLIFRLSVTENIVIRQLRDAQGTPKAIDDDMRAVNSPACPPSRKTASLALACLPAPSLPTVEVLQFIIWLGTAELPGRAPTGPKNVGAGPYTVKHIQTLNRPRCKPFHATSLPRAAPCILVARTDGDPTASALIYNRDRSEIHIYMYIYRRNHFEEEPNMKGAHWRWFETKEANMTEITKMTVERTVLSCLLSFSKTSPAPLSFSSLFYWLFSRERAAPSFLPSSRQGDGESGPCCCCRCDG